MKLSFLNSTINILILVIAQIVNYTKFIQYLKYLFMYKVNSYLVLKLELFKCTDYCISLLKSWRRTKTIWIKRIRNRTCIKDDSTMIPFQVKLEQILGISATSNNSLSYNPNTENILYTAGWLLYTITISNKCFMKL